MAGFTEIAQKEFEFLEQEFNYEVVEVREKSDGGFVTYVNREAGVGVKLLYEFSSAFVFVFICRLVDGELCENPLPIGDDTEIICFDFNDYLEAESKMRPAYDYGEDSEYYDPQNGLRNFTREFAKRLQANGQQILKGDLSALPAMASIIKRRAESLKHT
jgi:hypothetical protein